MRKDQEMTRWEAAILALEGRPFAVPKVSKVQAKFITEKEKTESEKAILGDLTIAAYCRKIGMSKVTVWKRMSNGMSLEEATTKPIQAKKKKPANR